MLSCFRRMLATAALLLAIPGAAFSQARSDLLVAGAHVRFHTRMYDASFWNGGRVDSVTPDSVYIVSAIWGMKPLGLARSDFTRLDVSTGRTSRVADTFQGIAIGVLAGGLTGVAIGAASGTTHNCEWICTASDKAALLGAAGAIGGLVIGGIIGAIRSPSEHWTTVIPPSGAAR